MKHSTLIICLVLIISLLVSTAQIAYAYDLTELQEAHLIFQEEEQRRIQEILSSDDIESWIGVERENLPLDPNVSAYPTCPDCASISVTVCAAEATLDSIGTHKTILGLWGEDCHISYFVSSGADMCPNCYRIIFVYDSHLCWEVHDVCDIMYDVCPMQVS